MFNETDVDVEVADSVKFTYKEDGFIKQLLPVKQYAVILIHKINWSFQMVY